MDHSKWRPVLGACRCADGSVVTWLRRQVRTAARLASAPSRGAAEMGGVTCTGRHVIGAHLSRAPREVSHYVTCGRRRYAILSAHIKYLTRCLLPSREALTVTSTKCGLNFCSDSMNEGLASSAEEVYYRRQSR